MKFHAAVENLAHDTSMELGADSLSVSEKDFERLLALVDTAPKAAILSAWDELESAAVSFAQRNGEELTESHIRKPLLLIRMLCDRGAIDERKLSIFRQLRSIRNSVKHHLPTPVIRDEAIAYIDSVVRLKRHFELVNTSDISAVSANVAENDPERPFERT